MKRFVRTVRGPQRPEAAGIILTAVGEEAEVDYGSGPMVREPQSGKYRRTRLFVVDTRLQPQISALANLAFEFAHQSRTA